MALSFPLQICAFCLNFDRSGFLKGLGRQNAFQTACCTNMGSRAAFWFENTLQSGALARKWVPARYFDTKMGSKAAFWREKGPQYVLCQEFKRFKNAGRMFRVAFLYHFLINIALFVSTSAGRFLKYLGNSKMYSRRRSAAKMA